jgi:dihydrofolate reductase
VNNSTIDRSDPPAGVARLKAEPGGDILIYGSLTVVGSLMDAGLVDRFRLWVHPVILGDAGGRRVGEGYQRHDLSVADTSISNPPAPTPSMDGAMWRTDQAATGAASVR